MKQCAALYIDPRKQPSGHHLVLKRIGFAVRVTSTWPEDDALLAADVVVVLVHLARAPMVAARLRARAGFGRRLLIALVPSAVSRTERRAAIASGFDDVATERAAPRELAIRVLRRLRGRADSDCMLPQDGKRSAA